MEPKFYKQRQKDPGKWNSPGSFMDPSMKVHPHHFKLVFKEILHKTLGLGSWMAAYKPKQENQKEKKNKKQKVEQMNQIKRQSRSTKIEEDIMKNPKRYL